MKYTNQKTSLQIISGKIKSINEGNQSLTVTTNIFDRKENKYVYQDLTICSQYPLTGLVAGKTITAVGYPNGQDSIMAQHIASEKSACFETADLCVLSGNLVSAKLNEEKTEDGSAKLKQDGTPRKPHYDIMLDVVEGDKTVHHVVKVYNMSDANIKTNEDGTKQKQPIEKMLSRFKDFKNNEETPMYVTVVTGPGNENTSERIVNNQTQISYYSNHLGQKTVDAIPLYQKTKTQEQTQTQAQPAQTAQPAAPVQPQPTAPVQPQPQPQPVAPAPAPAPAVEEPTQSIGGQGSPAICEDVPFLD